MLNIQKCFAGIGNLGLPSIWGRLRIQKFRHIASCCDGGPQVKDGIADPVLLTR